MSWWEFILPGWVYGAYLRVTEHTACRVRGHVTGRFMMVCRRCGADLMETRVN